MDGFTSLAFTQTLLIGALLGTILIWMVTFTILAFRSDPRNRVKLEDESTSAQSFLAITGPHKAHAYGIAPSYQMVPRPIETGGQSSSGEMGTVSVG